LTAPRRGTGSPGTQKRRLCRGPAAALVRNGAVHKDRAMISSRRSNRPPCYRGRCKSGCWPSARTKSTARRALPSHSNEPKGRRSRPAINNGCISQLINHNETNDRFNNELALPPRSCGLGEKERLLVSVSEGVIGVGASAAEACNSRFCAVLNVVIAGVLKPRPSKHKRSPGGKIVPRSLGFAPLRTNAAPKSGWSLYSVNA
jgi:hypothetical protein